MIDSITSGVLDYIVEFSYGDAGALGLTGLAAFLLGRRNRTKSAPQQQADSLLKRLPVWSWGVAILCAVILGFGFLNSGKLLPSGFEFLALPANLVLGIIGLVAVKLTLSSVVPTLARFKSANCFTLVLGTAIASITGVLWGVLTHYQDPLGEALFGGLCVPLVVLSIIGIGTTLRGIDRYI